MSPWKVQDYGPLAPLIGTWKTVPSTGRDVAPGQTGSDVGKGGKAVSPFYEIITITPNIPETNHSDENLISVFYHQVVYRTTNNHHFHDQIGYLSWDKTNNLVYDTSCVPRGAFVLLRPIMARQQQRPWRPRRAKESPRRNIWPTTIP